MRPRAKVLGLLILLGVLAGSAMLLQTLRYGFSSRDEPTSMEALAARTMRRYAVPSDLRGRKNPVPLTPDLLSEARAHFADHCASCHGNDGRGQTSIGRSFYPKAPDMTLADTQSQSDGELFATIENGIRLTGMPAWGNGTAESAHGSWELVHFIRHLPKITPDEIAEMESLNPKSRNFPSTSHFSRKTPGVGGEGPRGAPRSRGDEGPLPTLPRPSGGRPPGASWPRRAT